MDKSYDFVYHCDARPEIGNGHLGRGVAVLNSLHARNPGLKLAACGSFSENAQRFIKKVCDPAISIYQSPGQLPIARVAIHDSMDRPEDPGYVDRDRSLQIKNSCERFVYISSSLAITLPVACDLFIDHMPDVIIDGIQPDVVCKGFRYVPVSDQYHQGLGDLEYQRPNHLVAIVGGSPTSDGPFRLADAFYDRVLTEFDGFTILLSPLYPEEDRKRLEQEYPWLDVLSGIPSLAPLLQTAEAVICTYGNVTYESLSCGKATYNVSYAEFQNEYAQYLERKGMVKNLGYFDTMNKANIEHMFSPARRKELTGRILHEFDHSGIENISDELLALLDS